MAIILNDNLQINAGKPSESKYLNSSNVPYSATTEVTTALAQAVRHVGLTVLVNDQEYWFATGTTNGDLVIKSADVATGGGITGATNGLTKVGSDVVLGGTLTGDTTIDGDTNDLILSFTGGSLVGADDYTSSYTPLSYVQKTYVTGLTSGLEDDITFISGETASNDADITFLSGATDTNSSDIASNDADITFISGETASNDADIAFITGNTVNTASNGLTKTGTDVELGGTLDSATSIAGAGNSLSITNTSDLTLGNNGNAELSVTGGSGVLDLNAKSNSQLVIKSQSGSIDGDVFTNSIGFNLDFNGDIFNIIDNRATATGIEYAGNYASNFVDRSLVDKAYVDALASGLDPKDASNVATTTNIDLTGGTFSSGSTIDGIVVEDGWRVLVKDQTDASENGIYVYSASTSGFSRTEDFDGTPSNEVTTGAFTAIISGNTNATKIFTVVTPDPITVGTTDINWTILSKQLGISAGDGIAINTVSSTEEVSIDLATNSGLDFTGTQLRVAPTIAGDGIDLTSGVLSVNSNNGLTTTTGGDVVLGGTLTGDTTIDMNSNGLVIGSSSMIATGLNSLAIGSGSTCTTSDTSVVIGSNNTILGGPTFTDNVLLGGIDQSISSSCAAAIAGGISNDITSSNFGAIIGSRNSSLNGSFDSTILGGFTNGISGNSFGSVIVGGSDNIIDGSACAVLIGGNNNTMTGTTYDDHVGVSNLAILTTPTNDTSSDQVLVRDNSTGIIGYVSKSSVTTTATNGLSVESGNIVLGGTLTGDTTVDNSGHAMKFGETGSYASTGSSSFAAGYNSSARGNCAISLGWGAKADGDASAVLGGSYTYSYGLGSVAVANGFACGDYSFAGAGGTTNGNQSVAFGESAYANGDTSFAIGTQTRACGNVSFAGGCGINTKRIIANGIGSFNFSRNTASQTNNHGANADHSVILGGIDHNIESGNTNAAIIGGDTIKLTGTTYTGATVVGRLGIYDTPINNTSSDQVLVRNDSTGIIGYVSKSSLGATANNGLSVAGSGDVVLGGTLTGDTSINMNTFGLVIGSPAGAAEGSCAVSIGLTNNACADYSFSTGSYNTITTNGCGGHAEGQATTVDAPHAHSEGISTSACGQGSHAEGSGSISFGNYSHAEGIQAYSCGNYSHAEGIQTCSVGNQSHAEGNNSKSFGNDSHAEGLQTCAIGRASNSKGNRTHACGNYSLTSGFGISTKEIIASGNTSFNHSINNTNQIVGHGALADYSTILGGRNHNIEGGNIYATIIGGDSIKLTGTTYTGATALGTLAIFDTPATGSVSDPVLVWDSADKIVKQLDSSNLGEDNNSYAITAITSATLSADNYVAVVQTSGSSQTVTLPAAPTDGQAYKIKDRGNALTNQITVDGNGNNIDGSSTATINTDYGALELVYSSDAGEWLSLAFIN